MESAGLPASPDTASAHEGQTALASPRKGERGPWDGRGDPVLGQGGGFWVCFCFFFKKNPSILCKMAKYLQPVGTEGMESDKREVLESILTKALKRFLLNWCGWKRGEKLRFPNLL